MFEQIRVLPATEAFQRYFQEVEPEPARQSIERALLQTSTPALTAVIEEGYIDIDYSSAYYMQIGRSFTPTRRETTRVHFFASEFTKRRLMYPSVKFVGLLKDSYLGFVVIRPSTPSSFGRTFISSPKDINNSKVYCPPACIQEVNLCGLPLRVNGSPYLSQDQMVLACATASLWMSSTPLATKIREAPQYTTSEITSVARSLNRGFSPAIGSEGLSLQEMRHAFEAMGYDPKMWEYPEARSLFEACHIYVESGIAPVVVLDLGDGLHAVTIVGHSFDTSSWTDVEIFNRVHSSAEFVPELIVNDDQRGLYLTAKVNPINNLPYRAQFIINPGTDQLDTRCQALLVPLPSRVMLDGNVAMQNSAIFLDYLRQNRFLDDRELLIRTFLVRSNTYKTYCLERQSMPGRLRTIYRSLPMPRYIWVTEFGYLDEWRHADPSALRIRGELIFDSTRPAAHSLDLIAVHVPDAVSTTLILKNEEQTKNYILNDDQGYSPFDLVTRP